jgi:hypothetical protein
MPLQRDSLPCLISFETYDREKPCLRAQADLLINATTVNLLSAAVKLYHILSIFAKEQSS